MPGYLCTGVATQSGYLPKESRAFSEGIYYRAQGASLTYPITDNPHPTGSSAYDAWHAGWTVADNAALGTIAATAAPCVAVPTNTIAA